MATVPRALRHPAAAALAALLAFLGLLATVDDSPPQPPPVAAPDVAAVLGPAIPPRVSLAEPPLRHVAPPRLPGGGTRIFASGEFLVAYYGTARTGSLGVLGETSVDRATRRLAEAAAPFRRRGERLQPVFELIVTVADAVPGKDGDYSHDIRRSLVEEYIRAAHRHRVLLLLDLQPGRTGFLDVARRWGWALRDPWVGLALDPEWRMGRRQVPGRVIGSVSAAEVNRTSAWLAGVVRREHLPEKLFVLHQFRTAMLPDLADIEHRPGLAMVQHVDGFGTPRQKLATFRTVVRPRQFHLGLKLFYDEDRRLLSPARVRAIRPAVRFVSYQ